MKGTLYGRFIIFIITILFSLAISGCGANPKEVCFGNQTLELVKGLVAERHAENLLEKARFANALTGGF